MELKGGADGKLAQDMMDKLLNEKVDSGSPGRSTSKGQLPNGRSTSKIGMSRSVDPIGRGRSGSPGGNQLDEIEADILGRAGGTNVRGRSVKMSRKQNYPYDDHTPADAILDQEVELHDQAQIALLKKVIKDRATQEETKLLLTLLMQVVGDPMEPGFGMGMGAGG